MTVPGRRAAVHWVALALLALSVGINYLDRGNLSVALSAIQRDIHLDAQQLGLLSAAFFVSYSFLQVAAGKLMERFPAPWVLAGGYLLWSGATAFTGLARGFTVLHITVDTFAVLFLMRILLGCGESVAYPAYAEIICSLFPETLRGAANATIDAGSKIGPAVGVMLGVELVAWRGWRAMFLLIGAGSLLWLGPWCWLALRLKSRPRAVRACAPSYFELLRKRVFLGAAMGQFGANYAWFFFLTWLPYYFEKERHFSRGELALVSSLPFWASAVSSMSAGLAADAIVRRGRLPAVRVRQATVSIGLLGACILTIPAVLVRQELVCLALVTAACISFGLFSSNHWALSQGLAGRDAAAKWTALQNCFGNSAGVAAAWITGAVVHATGSFMVAFAIVSAVLIVLGVGGYWLVIGKATAPLADAEG